MVVPRSRRTIGSALPGREARVTGRALPSRCTMALHSGSRPEHLEPKGRGPLSVNNVVGAEELADVQHHQDTHDHEEAAEHDGRSDLKPFVKAMGHAGDGIQGRDPSR
jgi:hypothetical protein